MNQIFRKRRYLSAIVFWTLTTVWLSGLKAQTYDLASCIRYAQANNPELVILELGVERAVVGYENSKMNYLPNLNARFRSGNYSGLYIDPTTNLLDFGNNYINSFRLNSEFIVFRGFYNKYYKQLKRSEISVSQLEADIKFKELKLEISFLFCQMAQASASKTLIQRRQEVLAQRKAFIEGSIEAGTLHQRDMLFMAYLMAQDEATLLQTENREQIYKSELLVRMGLPPDEVVLFDMSGIDMVVDNMQAVDYQNIIGIVKTNFPHIALGNSLLERATHSLNLIKTAHYPSLSIMGALSTNASSRNATANTTQQFLDNNQQYIGINLNIPIFNRHVVKERVAFSILDLEAARLSALQLALELESNVYKAVLEYNSALKVHTAQQKKYEAALEDFNFATRRFDVGSIGIYELTDITSRLITAETDMLNAKYNLLIKKMTIDFYSKM